MTVVAAAVGAGAAAAATGLHGVARELQLPTLRLCGGGQDGRQINMGPASDSFQAVAAVMEPQHTLVGLASRSIWCSGEPVVPMRAATTAQSLKVIEAWCVKLEARIILKDGRRCSFFRRNLGRRNGIRHVFSMGMR